MQYKNRKFSIWITGLPGSGKTKIGKLFFKLFKKKYGETIFINGDDLRNIFDFKKYDIKSRKKLAIQYSKLFKFISNQNINIIFTCVAMFDDVRELNSKRVMNYIEIYIKANIQDIIKSKRKKLYNKKKQNLVGIDLRAELPKKSHIKIINNLKRNPNDLAAEMFFKFENLIKRL